MCVLSVSVYIFYVYTRIRKNLCMRWSREDGRERVSENKCPYSKCTWHNQNFLGLVVVCFFSFLLFFKIGYLDWVSVVVVFFGAFCCYFLFRLRAFLCLRKIALNRATMHTAQARTPCTMCFTSVYEQQKQQQNMYVTLYIHRGRDIE